MAATVPSPDSFTRVSDMSEKERLIADLVKTRGEIIAKKLDPSAEVFVLLPYDYRDKKIFTKITGSSHPTNDRSGQLVISYFIGGEKYFQMCDYQIFGEQIQLSNDGPIFHLQRRQDYRVRLSNSFKVLLEIVSINGIRHKKSIPLVDLSGGGCRIQLPTDGIGLKVSDEMVGHLFLQDRPPIEVTCSVRHFRHESNQKQILTYGLQFVGMSKQTKNSIIGVVMDLYRQLFSGRI